MFATCYVFTHIELLYSLVVHLRKVAPVHLAFAVSVSCILEALVTAIEVTTHQLHMGKGERRGSGR